MSRHHSVVFLDCFGVLKIDCFGVLKIDCFGVLKIDSFGVLKMNCENFRVGFAQLLFLIIHI